MRKMRHYGQKGVDALKAATPKDSGATAEAWRYEIVEEPGRTALYWRNEHVVNGTNIAVILQYGHATRNGGFVEGTDSSIRQSGRYLKKWPGRPGRRLSDEP